MKNRKQKDSKIDFNKTLEQLEKNYWPAYQDESSLIKNCHEYRKIRLIDLNVENLRLLIGQNIGNKYLIPIAMDKLAENILIEGDFFEGDLLLNVLTSDNNYWINNKDQYVKMINMINDSIDKIRSLQTTKEIRKWLLESIEKFNNLML